MRVMGLHTHVMCDDTSGVHNHVMCDDDDVNMGDDDDVNTGDDDVNMGDDARNDMSDHVDATRCLPERAPEDSCTRSECQPPS
jgi:hypothetical protein